jgi:hypothetical protein
MAKTINYVKRLAEIAKTAFGELSDEEVLHLLAERKQLQELQEQYEELQREQIALAQAEEERGAIMQELDRLNKLISPDKPDDELIHLVEERKIWEAKLETAEMNLTRLKSGEEGIHSEQIPALVTEVLTEEPAPVSEPAISEGRTETISNSVEETIGSASVDQEFGMEKITERTLDENSEFFPYLEEIQNNVSSIGRILEGLPIAAKKDKLFMLAVAKIDPAYAVHYADKNSLKNDEDFNLSVASMKGNAHSGSALSEMPPEARTPAVVMAAIKSDYRNVRFLLPQMEGYDDMLNRAKSGAIQKLKELKDSADVAILIPKILQKDKAFMKEVEEIVPKANE